jgi:hypothetical protein
LTSSAKPGRYLVDSCRVILGSDQVPERIARMDNEPEWDGDASRPAPAGGLLRPRTCDPPRGVPVQPITVRLAARPGASPGEIAVDLIT